MPGSTRIDATWANAQDVQVFMGKGTIASATNLNVSLPFSWKAFYAMSCCFIAGLGAYRVGCPEIIRKYGSFGDYRRDHLHSEPLQGYTTRALARSKIDEQKLSAFARLLSLNEQATTGTILERANKWLDEGKETIGGDIDVRQSKVFAWIVSLEEFAHRSWFWLSALFFSSGIALFAVVAVQSFASVIRMF